MKLLWFSNTSANAASFLKIDPIGGGWLKSLDKALNSKVDLHVAFYYPHKNEKFEYNNTTYHPICKKNWKIKVLRNIFWSDFITDQDLPLYLKIINEVNPDIIHIHGTENPFGCIIPVINIPVVVSIQGCITVYNHKFQNDFTKYNLRLSSLYFGRTFRQFLRRKSFMKTWKEFKRMAVREQHNLLITKYVIGRTDWDRRITSLLAPNSLYYHCDEILRDVFYINEWHCHEIGRRILIHSTISNSTFKGFETICETLYLLNKILRHDIEWAIAGISSNDSIVRVTKNQLKKKFPIKGLTYLGVLNETKLLTCLHNANIYVSPTHIDNSPNSLCEAMLLGIPCISTFVGGTGSLLKNGEEGIMVQDGDPWSMAGAIIELLKDPGLAITYGKRARERAFKRHDKDRIVNDLVSIYKRVIEAGV